MRTRAVLWGLLGLLATAGDVGASAIVAPDIAVTDGGMAGNVVADPDDSARMLFHNPAGVTAIRGTEASYGLFFLPFQARYINRDNGFDEKSAELAVSPTVFGGTDRFAPWYVAFGLYGSVGSSFNFPGEPAAGFPNRFLGESTIVQLGILTGREVVPGLRFGVQIAPTFGRIRVRSPSPLGPVRFDVDGFGVGGAAGLLYDLGPTTSVGVGYRSPARVFLSGDADVGEVDDDLEITFHVPQSVEFGVAQRLGERVTVALQGRWTDYPDFEDGVFEYERTRELNAPFIRAAKARFRYGAGVEVDVTDAVVFRSGVSYESWMMEEESLSPLLYDNTDLIFGFGLGGTIGRWTIDGALGSAWITDRVVTADENAVFPGRYQLGAPIVAGIMVSRRFGDL
jgi:long-subunit fatty acid transport protein